MLVDVVILICVFECQKSQVDNYIHFGDPLLSTASHRHLWIEIDEKAIIRILI